MQTHPHVFKVGDSINGAIKKYNRYDVTLEEMNQLIQVFKDLNDIPVYRPGMKVEVPVLERHVQ